MTAAAGAAMVATLSAGGCAARPVRP